MCRILSMAGFVAIMGPMLPAVAYASGGPVSVDFVGQWGGASLAVAARGDYAYVGSGPRLLVFDVSNPGNLTLVGKSAVLPGIVVGLAVSGDYAYMAVGGDGSQVIDVSDAYDPRSVGGYDTNGYARGVAMTGDYAYVADHSAGLQVIDISDPSNPQWAGAYDTAGTAYDVAVSGGYA